MNPLDDHELLLWTMRAGLTRDEVRHDPGLYWDLHEVVRRTNPVWVPPEER